MANCVVFVPTAAVGAAGVPVNVGDANAAFSASAAASAALSDGEPVISTKPTDDDPPP